ncbi:RusA family crossover junction endodeoxyribonuclease [Acinetobacter ursingii]|uniref:RusA family crossover junction endodeoxyribonuclease n=1 Tax=Acinetobacter ursingii TaxID=108980 RepID=UPI0021D1E3A5|nr:RusA family crossover junction endodeoxyribonuclease [Acinetobacter ursingii]MCU4489918.1 RusA family crossover junction endodeoxyribonuclease [Acinetobacter ursingii]
MRWSESILEAHLKAHRNKASLAQERFKLQNDAKVHDQVKTRLKLKSKQNTNIVENLILDVELWTIPPSVNNYWSVTRGKKWQLSQKAQDFHNYVRSIVPVLSTDMRLKMDVTFHFPDNKIRDIDNYLKATIDSLVKCQFCIDDEQFDVLIVRRGEYVKGGLIQLKVWEI